MQKLAASLLVVGVTVGAVTYGTRAFFSDQEVSNNNTFAAGSIDLQVGGQYQNNAEGMEQNNGSFSPSNLNGQALFNFQDLKPGDTGGGNFEMVVNDNDSWLCMSSEITNRDENGRIDPELDAGDITTNPNGGELQDYIEFAFFNDKDGNGEWSAGDSNLYPHGYALPIDLTMDALEAQGWLPMADTTTEAFLQESPLTAGDSYYLGYLYCFGDLTWDGNEFSCNGDGEYNDAQTDRVLGSLTWEAVQSRNNEDFTCASMNPSEIIATTGSSWDPQNDGAHWTAKARFGDNNGSAGAYELEIGNGPGDRDEANHSWVSGDTESFTLSYDSTAGTATLTFGGSSVTHSVSDGNNGVGFTMKSPTDGEATVDNLMVNGSSISPDGVTSTNGSYQHINITGFDTSSDWTITGDATFTWAGTTANEQPAMEVHVGI